MPEIPTIRFSVFSLRPIAGLAFRPHVDGAFRPLVFFPTARSPEYEYRGDMPMKFVDALTGAVAAEAAVPPDIRRALLLFMPVKGDGVNGIRRYQVSVLDDETARHGPQGLVLLNLSGLLLTGTINHRRVDVGPGLNPAIRVGETANLALEAVFRNRRYRSYADTVSLGPGERALLVLYPPFHPGSLEVQGRMLVDGAPAAPFPGAPRKR